jgi:5-methylcytosine-specific restriction endonuclease McrA
MAQANKVCKVCGERGHSKYYCRARVRTPIPKAGKQARNWTNYRRKYFDSHPPNSDGLYRCYLCLALFPREGITLDHVIPRSGAPQLRYDDNNIRYACGSCNHAKGSKRY